MSHSPYVTSKNEPFGQLRAVIDVLPSIVQHISLRDFHQSFVYGFDPEALFKTWKPTAFQNTLEHIWESNSKSCVLAPRAHLKTSTVLSYLIKKVYTRQHPLEISYYHLTGSVAAEKFAKLLHTIENNPLLVASFHPERAKQWSQRAIELEDGTLIKPLSYKQGVRGKHPHIIVLDDVIDTSVVYSDLQNRKAIEKFYTDIYPMIGNTDKNKKIIVIGTAQRKDDLYHRLPEDFSFHTFQAVVSEEHKEVLSPELFSYDSLMKLKADISAQFGERFWQKEYMNVPFEAMGLIIKPEWITEYVTLPSDLTIFQGWDLAVSKDLEKGDWTACVTIGIKYPKTYQDKIQLYILNVFRKRLNFGGRLNAIQELFAQWKPNVVGIEEVAFQYDTIQTLQQATGLPILGVKSIQNKVQSFRAELAPYFENGQIFLKPNMDEFKNELLSLPVGQFNDQADALKIAIKIAAQTPQVGHLTDDFMKSMQQGPQMITKGLMNRKF